MSEKDLEQFNADVQENEAATAAPVDNASPEAIGEAIKGRAAAPRARGAGRPRRVYKGD